MHEMSIMMSIIEIADKEVIKSNSKYVEKIELDIGALSGVEIEALEFAWEVSKKDTIMENAQMIINHIEGKSKCTNCNHIFDSTSYIDSCPKCDEIITEIIQGKELKVRKIILNG